MCKDFDIIKSGSEDVVEFAPKPTLTISIDPKLMEEIKEMGKKIDELKEIIKERK